MFRATQRLAQQQVRENLGHMVKKTSYTKDLFTDVGNRPIVAANLVAAGMVVTVSTRKLFYHPDISVDAALRTSNEVQNELPQRLDDAGAFRSQTKAFASFLVDPTQTIMKFATGQDAIEQKYQLKFIRNHDVEAPLENTNYFEDGLYETQTPGEFAANADNYSA